MALALASNAYIEKVTMKEHPMSWLRLAADQPVKVRWELYLPTL